MWQFSNQNMLYTYRIQQTIRSCDHIIKLFLFNIGFSTLNDRILNCCTQISPDAVIKRFQVPNFNLLVGFSMRVGGCLIVPC